MRPPDLETLDVMRPPWGLEASCPCSFSTALEDGVTPKANLSFNDIITGVKKGEVNSERK